MGAPPIRIDLLSSLSGVIFQQAVIKTIRVEIADEILPVIGSAALRQPKQVKGVAKPSDQSGRCARCGARAPASWGCSTTCSVRRINNFLNQSPEQIATWLRRTYHETARMQMSDEARYKRLFMQARGVLEKKLVARLRTHRMMRSLKLASKLGVRSIAAHEKRAAFVRLPTRCFTLLSQPVRSAGAAYAEVRQSSR